MMRGVIRFSCQHFVVNAIRPFVSFFFYSPLGRISVQINAIDLILLLKSFENEDNPDNRSSSFSCWFIILRRACFKLSKYEGMNNNFLKSCGYFGSNFEIALIFTKYSAFSEMSVGK